MNACRAVRDFVTALCAAGAVVLSGAGAAFAQGTLVLELDPSSEDALSASIAKVADEAYKLNLRGLDALEKRDNAAALEFFNRAVTIFPQYSDALNNRGVALYRRGDITGARRAWEQTVKIDPRYHIAYYNLGLILLHEKKPDEALRQFETALRHNRKFTEAILRVGVIHLQSGNTAAAIDRFAKAYKDDPKHPDAWNFYAYGLILTGDTARAITVFRGAGDHAEAQAQLGRIEASRRRYAQAASHLARAVELGAPASVRVELASARIDAGQCAEALKALDEYFAREARPSADAWLLAGYAARDCHGPQKAAEYYERGLRLYPRDQLLNYNAGYLYFTLNDHARAERLWSVVGDAFPNPSLYHTRAVIARERGDLKAAEAHIRKAISMDENADFYDFLGVLSAARGDSKAAQEHFRRALRIDPTHASAQLNMAAGGQNPAELAKAVANAEKRLSACRGKNCADAALQLSILYFHQKKTADALKAVESVKESDRDLRIYRHIAVYNRELRRYDRAVAALEAAAKRFPLDMKAQYELAEAYLSAGAPSKAARIFETLLPKWRDNMWRLHYQLGYAYMDMGELRKAKDSFEKSIAAKSNNPAARGLLAFVLNRMGDTEKAVAEWERTVKEDAGNATIHVNLGISYESGGQYDKALESYRKALSIDPKNRAVHINMGNAYRGLERYAEAFEAYRLGMDSDKREEAAYNTFILARMRGDRTRAERMFELLKKEFPRSRYLAEVAAEWELDKKSAAAKTAFDKGDFRTAFTRFRDIAGASSGKSAEAHMYNAVLSAHNAAMHREAMAAANEYASKITTTSTRADLMRAAGNSAFASRNWGEAKKWYSQLVTIEPNNAVTLYNLAVAHYNSGEAQDAYNMYQQAKKIDGKIRNDDIENRYRELKSGSAQTARTPTPPQNDSLTIWYNRAVSLQNAKKADDAEKLYMKILERDSSFGLAWANLGVIYGARGDLEEAAEAYLKALAATPSPGTYANLANVYLAMNDKAKARSIVKEGLEKNPGDRTLMRLERQIR